MTAETHTRTVPGYLTPAEAAREIERGRTWIYALIERDRLDTVKISGRLLITAESFEKYKAGRTPRAAKTTAREGTTQ